MSQEWPSIAALTASAAERFGTAAPAVIDGDVATSFAELYEEARRFGAALVAAGVRPDDRVAIWAFNCREWIVADLGIQQAGATLVPVNTRFKGIEAATVLARAHVKALVTVTDFLGNDYLGMLASSGIELPDLTTTVIARGSSRDGTLDWDAFLATATPEGLAEVDGRRAERRPTDPADLLFTSGTTGTPKGVIASQSQSMAVGIDWVRMAGLVPGDRYLQLNPYFHMFGLKGGILACLASGATMLPVPVFDIDAVLALVASHHVSVLPGAPTVYQSILEHPSRDSYDLSSLRVAVTGAADIPVELVRRIYAELPFEIVVSGYGLTEGGTATGTSHDDSPDIIATTVGRARPGFEIRIADAQGNDLPAGEVGQILLRGPSVMTGYLDDPAATKAVLSDDGWLETGDLGWIGEDGCMRISGRSKDMFIVGGFNAYPAEIESIILRHPAVQQVAVVGVADERLGQVGMAFVVAREPLTEDELVAWCRENMANYKVPRYVTVIDELPLNATGKVQKTVLATWGSERVRR